MSSRRALLVAACLLSAACTDLKPLPCDTCADLLDTDHDGLPDAWETHGVDFDGDGVIDLDLPALGANPLRKDVFVELDHMEVAGPGGHSDLFSSEAIARVERAFLDAPIVNPDGSTGISLHIDAGPDSVMDPRTGATWGMASRAHVIPHADVSVWDGTTGGDLKAFYDAYLPEERRHVFHYGVAVHAIAPLHKGEPCPDQIVQYNGIGSGPLFFVSQGSHDSLLVELGGFQPDVYDEVQEAGLLMHELGHTLGLDHGGKDGINRKPNYLSVMNYDYGYRGLWKDGHYGTIDYARFDLPTLDEGALDEHAGLFPLSLGANTADRSELAGYGTIRFCGEFDLSCVQDLTTFQGKLVEEPDATAPMDWSCDGTLEEAPVSAEITATFPHERLEAKSDWARLDFSAGGVIGKGGGPVAEARAPSAELEPRDPMDAIAPIDFRVLVAGQGVVRRGSSVAFAIVNRGAREDTFTLQIDARGDTEIVGPRLRFERLPPGDHAIVYVSTRGGAGAMHLRATSDGNPQMAANATTTIE